VDERLPAVGFLRRKKEGNGSETRDGQRPLREVPYVFFDTELTGLDEKKDSILSIGAVNMTNGRIELGTTFYQLVKPRSFLNGGSVVIHEITPSEVTLQPEVDQALADFLKYIEGRVLAGYYLSIDLSFVNREMRRIFDRSLDNPAVDTYRLYQWLHQKHPEETAFAVPAEKLDLYALAQTFDIPYSSQHNALEDALIAAQVFQRFIPWLNQSGIQTLEELIRLGDPYKGGEDRFRVPTQVSNL
jgi:DNA polymerase III subunit epsilon